MTIDLYYLPASGPCRTVRLVAAYIGVDLNLKQCNLFKGEHRTPEFLKMNPQHAIPTLNDNGFYLAESRAIATYLIEKYAKDDSLYPRDPQKRAVINQRLYFDMGNLYDSFVRFYLMPLYTDAKQNQGDLEKLNQALKFLDVFLDGQDYVAGKHLTVADISIASSVSNLPLFDHDLSQYENVSRWFIRMKSEIPKYKEINEAGLVDYKQLIDSVKSNKIHIEVKPTF